MPQYRKFEVKLPFVKYSRPMPVLPLNGTRHYYRNAR